MAPKPKYLRLRTEGGQPVSVVYSYQSGVEIEEGLSKYMKAAYKRLRNSYKMALTAPKPVLKEPPVGDATGKSSGLYEGIGGMYRLRTPEEVDELATKHFLRLLNDIEERVSRHLAENPFEKAITIEDVEKRQNRISSDAEDTAKAILSGLVEEHRKAGLKPDMVTYLTLQKHVSGRIKSLVGDLAKERRNRIRELERGKKPIPPHYTR